MMYSLAVVCVVSLNAITLLFVAFATSVALMNLANGKLVVCCIEITPLLFNFSAAIG
jgi:hypothetical protein